MIRRQSKHLYRPFEIILFPQNEERGVPHVEKIVFI
jgi:hypothetical protein